MNGDDRLVDNVGNGDKQRSDGSVDSNRVLDSKLNISKKNEKGITGTDSSNSNRNDKDGNNAKSAGHKEQIQMKPSKPTIKENWEKVDKLCPACGHVTEEAKGITRQNMRKLLVPKFTLNEAIYTFIILVVLALGFLYMSETAQCRDFAKRLQTNPQETCDMLLKNLSISGGSGVSIYSMDSFGKVTGPGNLQGASIAPDNYSFSSDINTNELTTTQS